MGVAVIDRGKAGYVNAYGNRNAKGDPLTTKTVMYTLVCIESVQRCVVILSNDVRSEAGFAGLARFILGETGVPYDWEYGDHAGKS